MFKNLNKKALLYLGIIVVAAFLVVLLIFYLSKEQESIIKETPKPTEKTMEQIIKDLTASQEKASPPEEKTMKGLTAPGKTAQPSEEIIKNLTAPE